MEDSETVPAGSPVEQNEPPVSVGSHTQQSEPIGDKNRINSMDLKKGRLCWSRRGQGRSCKGVLGRQPRSLGEKSCVCVGRRHVVGDGEAEVTVRSRDIRVEA
jgi:hypothetical protein